MAQGAGVAHSQSINSILFVDFHGNLNNGETIGDLLKFLDETDQK